MCRAEVSVNSVGSLLVAAGQWQQRDRGVWATVQFAFFRCSANRRMAACRYCCTATQAWQCQSRHPSHLTAAPAPPLCCKCGLQDKQGPRAQGRVQVVKLNLNVIFRLLIGITPGWKLVYMILVKFVFCIFAVQWNFKYWTEKIIFILSFCFSSCVSLVP